MDVFNAIIGIIGTILGGILSYAAFHSSSKKDNKNEGSTLALVGLCLALVSFASLFEFRLLLFSTIGTMLTNITARFRDIIASLVCVKLPTTVYAMNNVLFHGMSNSLLFFGHADL